MTPIDLFWWVVALGGGLIACFGVGAVLLFVLMKAGDKWL